MFNARRAASAAALCGRAGEDNQQDADDLNDGGLLMQHEESEEDAEGWFECHECSECGGSHVAQGEHLEREREDGQQDGQTRCGGEDTWGEVPDGLRYAGDGGGRGGDGNGEGECSDAGEAVPDLLGEQNVDGPTYRREGREPYASEVEVTLPGLGEQDDSEQRNSGPGQSPAIVTAHGCDGQRAEEFDRDGGAERDAFDRREESPMVSLSQAVPAAPTAAIRSTDNAEPNCTDSIAVMAIAHGGIGEP